MCEKIAAFSGIPGEAVLNLPDIESVYDVPFNVLKSGVLQILNKFVDDDTEPDMSEVGGVFAASGEEVGENGSRRVGGEICGE